MGKKGKKMGRKSKVRKFNGEQYLKRSTHSKKTIADKKAKQMRKTRMKVRVVPTKTEKGKKVYTLYAKPK